MDEIYQYIIGFLFGVFILMTIIVKDGWFNDYFNYAIGKEIIEKYEDAKDATDTKDTTDTKDAKDVADAKDAKDAKDNNELIEPDKDAKDAKDTKYDENDDLNNISCNENIIANFKIDRLLNKNYLLMLISSYDTYDNEKINDLVWTLDNKKGRKMYEVIVKDKMPEKIKYPLNPDIFGFNINNLTVASSHKSNSNGIDIAELTILITLKINSILKNNGRLINIDNVKGEKVSIIITDSKDTKSCSKDDANCENSINMLENNNIQDTSVLHVNKNYNIIINVNNNTYTVYNINEDIFKEDNTFLGLMIDKENITFYVNNAKTTFKMNSNKKSAGSESTKDIEPKYPIYINKFKDCDIILYSFALFNKSICEADMKAYKMYNNYYIYGKKVVT